MTNLVSPTLQVETDPHVAPNVGALTVLFAELSRPRIDASARADVFVREAMGRHELLATDIIKKRAGRVVKTLDGSVMADFPGPAFAVRAAIEMERAWVESNQSFPLDQQLDLRIGIHACAAEHVAIDLFGDSVSVAAAITKLAAPGQVLVSRSVHEAISGESDLHSQWFNQVALAGRTERQDIFEAHWAVAPANIPSRYNVLSQIGAGGMGVVYKVRDVETGETIALKVLKAGIAADPVMQEGLRREVCLARKVTHKNVCRIHDFNRANGTASVSMEFVDGESLLARLHRVGVLPWTEALEITRQICAGLREAHAQGIVHRDLKPANIMVDPTGTVKIMDFGIARLFQSESQMTGTMVGTPAYMSPEQVELKPVDARTDIYALGLLLYEMVTAVPAFAGDTPIAVAVKQLREYPQRPREIVPSLPAFAEAAILKCMQKDPAARFVSVDQLQMALEQKPKTNKVPAARSQFVPEILKNGKTIQRAMFSLLDQAASFLQRQNWSALRAKRVQNIAGVALGSVVLLAAGYVLVRSEGKAHGTETPIVNTAPAAGSWPDPQATTSTVSAPAPVVRMESVSIFNPNAIPADDANGNNIPDADADKTAKSTPHKVPVVHSQPVSRKSPAPAVAARPATATPSAPVAMASAVTDNSAVSVAPEVVRPNPMPVTPAAAAPDDSHAAAPTATDESVSGTNPAAPGLYLEVGSFKDPAWAVNAVDKLTALGFHATSVHKTVLWMQTYHVQVGPYASAKDAESARQSLAQQGLKSHVVK